MGEGCADEGPGFSTLGCTNGYNQLRDGEKESLGICVQVAVRGPTGLPKGDLSFQPTP